MRIMKWFVPLNDEEKRNIKEEVFGLLAARDQRRQCNICEYQDYKIVSRRYAGLYFSACIESTDNELATLEALHLFVEILDMYFESVCELDIMFNFHKVYAILDEIFLDGEVYECNKKAIVERVQLLTKIG